MKVITDVIIVGASWIRTSLGLGNGLSDPMKRMKSQSTKGESLDLVPWFLLLDCNYLGGKESWGDTAYLFIF